MPSTVKTSAVVLAAGKGLRMALSHNKVLVQLEDKPVLAWSLEQFEQNDNIAEIIIAAAKDDYALCCGIAGNYAKVSHVTEGGESRQQSMAKCLALLNPQIPWVMIHDAARPLVSQNDLNALLAAAALGDNAVLAVPTKNTIKKADAAGYVCQTLDRSTLWEVQTPQIFALAHLQAAYANANKDTLLKATDDAMLVESMGYPVKIVPGEYRNFKLTTPEDWQMAQIVVKNIKG